jgi:PBP1b-binding outer membrane lipoprotein LpoB
MKDFISLLLLAMLAVGCNSKTKPQMATPKATADTTVTNGVEKPATEQLYACPMHREVIGKKGEKCVKCDMKLTEPIAK